MLVDEVETQTEAAALCAALANALAALPPEDQLLLQMRYWSGLSVARIAVMTGHEQKGLYRRFERLAAELRRRLEAAGLSGESLRVLTGRFDLLDGATDLADAAGIPARGPSTSSSTGGKHA